MYSKPIYKEKNDILIPDNYRGNVLFNEPPQENAQINSDIKEADSPTTQRELTASASSETSEAVIASLGPPIASPKKGIFGSIGFEELLIIGVIFLLSQSENSEDVLWLLFLLLFNK